MYVRKKKLSPALSLKLNQISSPPKKKKSQIPCPKKKSPPKGGGIHPLLGQKNRRGTARFPDVFCHGTAGFAVSFKSEGLGTQYI